MSTLNDKNKQWLTNKLNGNFAENICSVHFQSLDYSVEKVGIENIAPTYAKNSNFFKDNFIKNHLNRTPDFIVSKGTQKAIFVEVKFNSTINDADESFYRYGSDLIIKYKNILFRSKFIDSVTENMPYQDLYKFIRENKEDVFKEDVKVYFYVVIPHKKYYNSYVFLFMPHTIIPLNNYGWRSAKHSEIDKISGIDEFHLRYKEIIEPFLENIFNNKNSK